MVTAPWRFVAAVTPGTGPRAACAAGYKPIAEAAEGFFVEARQRRAAKLIVDDQANRVGADVDDAVRRAIEAPGSLRVEIQRTVDRRGIDVRPHETPDRRGQLRRLGGGTLLRFTSAAKIVFQPALH
jgi:hypothetical protein